MLLWISTTRGSTGFGRSYRQGLVNAWGIADVEDTQHAISYLAEQQKIDPERCLIRGGSAGGYTVLSALTFTDTFKAGASLYGIGDLETLATDTHKFESRYMDSLIGPYPERRDIYLERSPIHHAEGLNCPVIFFAGARRQSGATQSGRDDGQATPRQRHSGGICQLPR